MSYVAVRWLSAGTTALAAVTLLASCAVGPDFVHPVAPEITRYTREPLVTQTSATDTALGARQRFAAGHDIPKEWWAMFKSPGLNALIERQCRLRPYRPFGGQPHMRDQHLGSGLCHSPCINRCKHIWCCQQIHFMRQADHIDL